MKLFNELSRLEAEIERKHPIAYHTGGVVITALAAVAITAFIILLHFVIGG